MREIAEFEDVIKDFYGSPYGIAVDCCTHAIELCLRLLSPYKVTCPSHTYLSIPMTFMKLNIDFTFTNEEWTNNYYIGNTNIIDAAVYWKEKSYITDSLMCLSFQHKKHLSLGRGGMILTDNYYIAKELKKMRYDGREDDIPWAEQNVKSMGYHYYMTPETALKGIEKFKICKDVRPKIWSFEDYPDLAKMEIFKVKNVKQE